MHYEEEVIDGVLCWRDTPGGEWTQFTPQQLTRKLLSVRLASQANLDGWLKVDKQLSKVQAKCLDCESLQCEFSGPTCILDGEKIEWRTV